MNAKKTRKKDVAVACGKSVFVVERDGQIGRMEIRDFRIIEGLLGEHLFPAFVRAFNGVERLDAIFHLLMLNARHLDQEKYPLAFDRNERTANFLLHGAFYECNEALRLLKKAGVARHIDADSASWAKLTELRQRWEQNEILKKMRHGFAHHLGDGADIHAGLERFRTGKAMTVFDVGTGPGPHGNAYPFAMQVLLHGSGIKESEFFEFVVDALADQLSLRTLVMRLFVEVLIHHGVELEIGG